ncbi:MAG: SDR family oxidoreductase [Elainellaceae cyanobacterium]
MSQRIVITGVSQGLGRAMAEGLIAKGHTVAGCARSPEAIAQLQNQFPAPHHFAQVDVTDAKQVSDWAEEVIRTVGVPARLINNAAIVNRPANLWEIPQEEFDSLIDINIKGVANVIRSFLPAMLDAGEGIIVNFSSGWGRSTSPQVAPYCASKWAIEGLTQALAQELPNGLGAIALNPGVIHTPMLETCFGDSASAYTSIAAWQKQAVPFLLKLSAKNNGQAVTVPA